MSQYDSALSPVAAAAATGNEIVNMKNSLLWAGITLVAAAVSTGTVESAKTCGQTGWTWVSHVATAPLYLTGLFLFAYAIFGTYISSAPIGVGSTYSYLFEGQLKYRVAVFLVLLLSISLVISSITLRPRKKKKPDGTEEDTCDSLLLTRISLAVVGVLIFATVMTVLSRLQPDFMPLLRAQMGLLQAQLRDTVTPGQGGSFSFGLGRKS